MATTKPFMFDNQTFDDHGGTVILPAAPKPIYTQDQMDQALRETHEQSLRQALDAAMQAVESDIVKALQNIEDAIIELGQQDASRMETIRDDSVEISLAILRKLLPNLAQSNALESISAFISQILSERFEEQRLVIRVAPAILENLKTRIDALAESNNFSGKMILLPEPSLATADCRVEWAEGGAERDTARLYQDIEQTIQQFLTNISSTGETA